MNSSNNSFVIKFEDQGKEISDYWHLCEELTIRQAALLIVQCDPASETGSYCEDWKPHERPAGYEAVKQGIAAALRKSLITGSHVGLPDFDMNGNEVGWISNTTDPDRSTIERDSLITWLESRGVRTGFFFPNAKEIPHYLDASNPRYPPKLAAAVRAWQAVTDPGKKSPKQALEKWLREHAADFGLTDEDGNPVNQAIEECAKVANWQPGGGVPKTTIG